MLIVCPSCASRYDIDPAKLGTDGRKVRCPSCAFEWHAHGEGTVDDPDPGIAAAVAAGTADGAPAMRPDQSAADFVAEEWARAAELDAAVSGVLSEQSREAENLPAEAHAPDAAAMDAAAAGPDALPADGLSSIVGKGKPARVKSGKSKWGGSSRWPGLSSLTGALRLRLGPWFGSWLGSWLGRLLKPLVAPAGIAVCGSVLLALLVLQRQAVVRVMPQMAAAYQAIGLPVNLQGLAFERIATELIEDAQGRFLIVQGEIRNVTQAPVAVPVIEVVVQDSAVKSLYTWTTEPPRPTLAPGDSAPFRTRLASPPLGGAQVTVRFAAAGKTARY